MESSRSSKRRRLISVSLYISPLQRPDLPARFESLNDDTLGLVLKFVGNKSYKSFGGVNKRCKEVYITSGMEKKTFLYGYAPLSVIKDRVERGEQTDYWLHETARGALSKGVLFYNRKDILGWAFQKRKTNLLREICRIAVEEERLDVLNKMWNDNEDDDDEDVFEGVDRAAARGGKLKVLKWLEDTGIYFIEKFVCAAASARHGHLHILKWFKEEKGLELDGKLYFYAIRGGGHLHVMKWLREQEVDWDKDTFYIAANNGNLNILQWLHDEGCPWDHSVHDDNRIRGEYLKPEVVEWLRANGYSNRIFH